jgi:hypothetical protein
MKLVTFRIGDNIIELNNNIWGTETVILNGDVVSQKWSVFGVEHPFTIRENDQSKEAMVKIGYNFPYGFQIDLSIDNKPIVQHSRSKKLFWIILGILILFVVAGFLLGIRDR